MVKPWLMIKLTINCISITSITITSWLPGVRVGPYSLVPAGFVVTWYDDFNGKEINKTNWVDGRYIISTSVGLC